MADCRNKAWPLVLLVIALLTCLHVTKEARTFHSSDVVLKSESMSNNDTILSEPDDSQYDKNTNAYEQVLIQEPEELWLWCQLDQRNTVYFFHFPHASQALLPCWSWFQKVKRARKKIHYSSAMKVRARTHCGFYLKDGLNDFVKPKEWTSELIRHMGCSVSESEPTMGMTGPDHCEENDPARCRVMKATLVYRLSHEAYHELHYFERPDDATALRAKVLRSLKFKDKHRTLDSARIAIINRKRSRQILNLDSIVVALQSEFPSAIVETARMEDMTPDEQFLFWSQHDVIITGHGAAICKCIPSAFRQ